MKRIILHRDPDATTFPLIDSSDDEAFYVFLFAPLGLLFLLLNIWGFLSNREPIILLGVGIALLLTSYGFHSGICCFQELEIIGDSVRLMLGPLVLREMAVSEIRTLALGVIPMSNKQIIWNPKIILLSPHPARHILEIGNAIANPVGEPPESLPPMETNPPDSMVLMDYYIKSHVSSLRPARGEGFWMEYSPERIEILKQLIPQAEDFVSPASEVTP